ncbi:MAG: tyrosine-type recombinase/integrase [Candidatus Komeilibacteria bacterium]|nr:tyrosine-type recombinase/integrase [Candidatus Komeilibacteria bacterium]MBT4447419.1 tyrosine-type recombinase/integrase [Candidatus Komeilibacteria bacterium]
MIKYKQYLKSLDLKSSTIKNYLWHINKFLLWLGDNKLDQAVLKKYFDYLLKKYKRVNTINLRLKIINNYLKFLNKRFSFDLLSDEDTNIKILTKQELSTFLKNPLKNKQLIGLRDKAILELLYSSGLKVGYLVNLKKDQIDDLRQEILLDKNKSLKINPSTWLYLKKYIDKRNDEIEYLFINFDRSNKSANKSLSVRSVERIINKYSKNIDPPVNINPQILRNTLAYQLKSEGAQSEHIKSALHFQTKSGAKNYLKRI